MATEEWGSIRRQKPLNEARVATYRRLMEAEELLEPIRERNGVSESAFADALEASLAGHEHEEDIYLATLKRFVEALGGRLEVRAVFPGETILFGG